MLINIERTWNVPCSITITYKVVFSKHCLHSLLTYSSWESNYSHQRSHDLVANEIFLVAPSWHSRKFSNFQYHRFRLYSENLKFLAMALEYVLFGYIEASIHEAVTFPGPLCDSNPSFPKCFKTLMNIEVVNNDKKNDEKSKTFDLGRMNVLQSNIFYNLWCGLMAKIAQKLRCIHKFHSKKKQLQLVCKLCQNVHVNECNMLAGRILPLISNESYVSVSIVGYLNQCLIGYYRSL